MKVKDLIEALRKYNPHADITLNNSEDITLSFVCKSNEEIFDKSTSPIVFIEPSDFCRSVFMSIWSMVQECVVFMRSVVMLLKNVMLLRSLLNETC